MKGKKDLRAYLTMHLNILPLVIVMVFTLLPMLIGNDVVTGLCIVLFCAWLFMIGMYLLSFFRVRDNIREIEQKGNLDSVLQDFENAKPALNGKLYFGENYLFGQGSGRVIRYDEVFLIYQYVHYPKYNTIVGERALKVRLKTGKEFSLCALKLKGEEDAELEEAVALICSHNPEIYIDPEKHIKWGVF